MVGSALHWHIEKTYKEVWDTLHDYSGSNGNGLSHAWKKLHTLLIKMFLRDLIQCERPKVLL